MQHRVRTKIIACRKLLPQFAVQRAYECCSRPQDWIGGVRSKTKNDQSGPHCVKHGMEVIGNEVGIEWKWN